MNFIAITIALTTSPLIRWSKQLQGHIIANGKDHLILISVKPLAEAHFFTNPEEIAMRNPHQLWPKLELRLNKRSSGPVDIPVDTQKKILSYLNKIPHTKSKQSSAQSTCAFKKFHLWNRLVRFNESKETKVFCTWYKIWYSYVKE